MDKDNAFVSQKGAADLLFNLKGSAKTFNELVKIMKLGPNTVLARLREAQKLGLVEEALIRKESGRPNIKYTLTAEGKRTAASFGSVQKDYEKLKKELEEIKKSEREKEARITQLLSSNKATNAKVSISGNKITKSKNVKLSIENDNSSD